MNIGSIVKYIGTSTGRDSQAYGQVMGFTEHGSVQVSILGGGASFL